MLCVFTYSPRLISNKFHQKKPSKYVKTCSDQLLLVFQLKGVFILLIARNYHPIDELQQSRYLPQYHLGFHHKQIFQNS